MARSVSGPLTATAGVCAVVVALAALDVRVREQLASMLAGRGATGEFANFSNRLHDFVMTAFLALRDQSIEHAALALFALAALVLFMFMTRT